MPDPVPKTLSPIALEYVQWWILPDDEKVPHSQGEWCIDNDVSPGLPSRWRKSPAWDAAVAQAEQARAMDPNAVAEVIETMRKAAVQGDEKAATVYLRYVSAQEQADDIAEMTDEELASELASALADVRARL